MSAHARRTELVAEVLASLEGVETLPPEEEARRLAEAQAMLSRILNNDPALGQPGLPGVGQ